MPTETYSSNGIKAELSTLDDMPNTPSEGESYSSEDFAQTLSRHNPNMTPEQCRTEANYLFEDFNLRKSQERREYIIGIITITFLILAVGIIILKSFTNLL